MSEAETPSEKPASAFTAGQNAQFDELFGISRSELERRGIDRTEFIQKELPKVARSERRMRGVWARASLADRLRHESSTWRLRSFYALMIALGILVVAAVQPSGPLRVALITVSGLIWIPAAIFGWLGIRDYLRWLRTRRSHGEDNPSTG